MKKYFWKIFWLIFVLIVLGTVVWRLSQGSGQHVWAALRASWLVIVLLALGTFLLFKFVQLIFQTSQRKLWLTILGILVLFIAVVIIDFPPAKLKSIFADQGIKLKYGLDLQGGTHLTYDCDLKEIKKEDLGRALASLKENIERRVNAFGVSEANVSLATSETDGKTRLIVELPGIKNAEEALNLIGKTAQLEFMELDEKGGWKKTGLTGKHLISATTQTNPEKGGLEIALQFNDEGKNLFAEITKRNLQKPVAIFLDQDIISAPTVQSVIDDGKAVITGKFDIKEARNLANLLNAGALPIPINLVSQTNVGATLGMDYLKKSLFGGVVGLVLVMIFMLIYYRYFGLVANLALVTYGLIILAIFKLSALTPWPVVLSLGGVAGFILSVGMAVDANILVYERMKEELRVGNSLKSALESGFRHAWTSIKDAYTSTAITCLILYWLGTGFIMGFALTLFLGILVSLLATWVFSKTILKVSLPAIAENKYLNKFILVE